MGFVYYNDVRTSTCVGVPGHQVGYITVTVAPKRTSQIYTKTAS